MRAARSFYAHKGGDQDVICPPCGGVYFDPLPPICTPPVREWRKKWGGVCVLAYSKYCGCTWMEL